jgi:glycosyltransferase involved in cell wall biosynthesis
MLQRRKVAKRMRIAQISPLFESVPPKLYGGTERIVSYLTEELVAMGHEVTLFASGDSITEAELVPMSKRALRLHGDKVDPVIYNFLMAERVLQRADEFDIIHCHIDYFAFPTLRPVAYKCVNTLHGRQDIPGLNKIYSEYKEQSLVSISDDQRKPLPGANFIATVYHGLPAKTLKFNPKPGGYVAFLGRMSPEKRPDRAIEIALKAGVKIKMAAKVDVNDQAYFESVVKPMLDNPLVEFIGEINETQKNEFLGNAKALLFPIDWPEPFGLVMIEAMACGTPVIAWPNGSVKEVIDEGMTGYIVESIEDAVARLGEIDQLSREKVRQRFESRFSSRRMALDYVRVYEQLARKPKARISYSEDWTAPLAHDKLAKTIVPLVSNGK